MLPKKTTFCNFGENLWRCSLCVLDCIVDKFLFLSLKACCTGCCGIKNFSGFDFVSPPHNPFFNEHVEEVCK